MINTVQFQAHQWLAVEAAEPEVCLCTGLGGGKTWTGARWLIGRALKFPNSIHLATVNSYPQAQDLVIPALTESCEEMGLDYQWRGGDKLPTLLINVGNRNAEIRVRSTEKFNRLRGPEYGSWWADEVRDAKRGAVEVVMGRLRCKKVDQPRTLWTTSPNGHDRDVWRRYRKTAKLVRHLVVERTINGKQEFFEIDVYRTKTKTGSRLFINCDTRVNQFVMEGYGERLAEILSGRLLDQERGGKIVATGDRVYEEFDRALNVSSAAVYRPNDPLFVALDFNVKFCSAALIQERIVNGAMRTLVVGEITCERGGTPAVIEQFKSRYGGHQNRIVIYGDATGWSNKSNGAPSDLAQWTHAFPGVEMRVPDANGAIIDRINAVNCRLCTSGGQRLILFNPDCEACINDCEQVEWHDKERKESQKKPELTHHMAGVGYFTVAEHPILIRLDTDRLQQGDRQLWKARS